MAELPGVFGRYRVEGLLGVGAFATVYKARDEALDVVVALKVLAENWAYDPEVRSRFINEAQLLRRVDGSRVVRVHDIGQSPEGHPWFVMDYAERGTVEDRLMALRAAGQALTVEDLSRFARLLAAGVAEVHRLGVVHRDLKPSNLLLRLDHRLAPAPAGAAGAGLVGWEEQLVVSDLGLARDLMGPTRLTAAVGTPGYMAPEQFDPSARADERTDLYACTAILHTLLVGEPPPPDTAERAAVTPLPEPVRRLLTRGLATDRAQRLATTHDWVEAVDAALEVAGSGWPAPALPAARALSSLGRTAPRDSLPPPVLSLEPMRPTPGPAAPRGWRRWWVTGAAAALAVTVIGGALVLRDDGGTGGGPSTTAAGGAPAAPSVDALATPLIDPVDVAVGPDGTAYVSELSANRVRGLRAGRMVLAVGAGSAGFSGDGAPGGALGAELSTPLGLGVGPDGTLYVADAYNGRVRAVDPQGTVRSVVGNGESGVAHNGQKATDAPMFVRDVEVGGDGQLYVVDGTAEEVWRIGADGRLARVAPEGTWVSPSGLARDPAGAIYVSDPGASVVLRVDTTGAVTVVAGTRDAPGGDGDGGLATAAQLSSPDGVAVAADGALLVADTGNHKVRRVASDGTISTLFGTGERDGADADVFGPAAVRDATDIAAGNPSGVAVAADGAVLVVDGYANRLWRVADGRAEVVAGDGPTGTFGDGLPAAEAALADPRGIGFDGEGRLYVAEGSTSRVRRVDGDGVITTIAGLGPNYVEPGTARGIVLPGAEGLAVDAAGNLAITTTVASQVIGVSAVGDVWVMAGNGTAGFSGDGGPGHEAQVNVPYGVTLGTDGVYVADSGNGRVRRVAWDGTIQTVAGDGTAGPTVRAPTPATSVPLLLPFGVAVGPDGVIYVAESAGDVVRRIAPDGTASVLAGSGQGGGGGDGGPAVQASVDRPSGLALGPDGSVYVAEPDRHRVRRIAPDGTISTVAGSGEAGWSGDGGPATDARLDTPLYLAVAPDGALHISDPGSRRIRRVDAAGVITTVAGAY